MMEKKHFLSLLLCAALLFTLLPATPALADEPVQEQFNLSLGGTYYFDMAPVATNHKWTPFTYVGTVNAYALDESSNGDVDASDKAIPYDHSLFVADYNLGNYLDWDTLESFGSIFGRNHSYGGVDYRLRCLSAGSTGSDGERGLPETNEWDQILDKDEAFIKNWDGIYSWGQDTVSFDASSRAIRGYSSADGWHYSYSSYRFPIIGWRPALEILNPDELGPDGLKTVTYDMGGNGWLGFGTLESATVVYTGDLILPEVTGANEINFTGSGTGTLGWYNGSTFYPPGTVLDSLPNDTILTPGYETPAEIQEQFTLAPGGTYYFDLSAQGVPGTVNDALPDTTLKWVPFTYAGTINAYSLDASSSDDTGASHSAAASDRSLFVADYIISGMVSWDMLNTDDADGDFIFGDDYLSDGVEYTLRSLSTGSNENGETLIYERGTPVNNEWDQLLNKNPSYIKNCNQEYSWGQDTHSSYTYGRAIRGGNDSPRNWIYSSSDADSSGNVGFRPALEIKSPDALGPDGLKTVTYDMDGNGTLGVGSLESATVVYTGGLTLPEISAANGFSYTDSGTGTLGWYDGSTFYEAGTVLDSLASGTTLTAGVDSTVLAESITVTGAGGTVSVQIGDNLQMLADVLPANATDNSVTWSIESGMEATIDTGGMLTATAEGSVTVRATANDGSGVFGDRVITITATPPTFVAVTNITGVPNTATEGVDVLLNGTIAPANATNQIIVWSIQDAGSTGATISGNTLSTTAAGIVLVRANITNGLSESSDYTQDFSITVNDASVPIYTITASAGRGGSISPNGAVSIASGGSQTFTITPDSGYRINSVTVDGVGQGVVTTHTFTNVTTDHAINAAFVRSSGGGGGGNGGGGSAPPTPSTPTYKARVKAENGTETTLSVAVNKACKTASLDLASDNLTLNGTIVNIPPIPGVNTYSVGVPISDLSSSDGQGALTLSTDKGSITIPSNMLTGVSVISGSKAEISIGQGNKDNLPDDVKSAIGDRPLVQLTLSVGGKRIDWSNPDAAVTVSIPYTPSAEELSHSESIVIWYIDGSGKVVSVPNGRYDMVTGRVIFHTTHFSDYVVAYHYMSFNDVPADATYHNAVSFIAARGITSGTGNRNFSPGANLTRGEFIVMMMIAYGVAPDENPDNNFDDAGNTYYTGFLAAAKRLGITAGIGNNLYGPGMEIIRQEMYTLLYNALKVINRLPESDSGRTLSDFSDADQISGWARDAMKLMVESGALASSHGILAPLDMATRAEMAQVLYNLLGKLN